MPRQNPRYRQAKPVIPDLAAARRLRAVIEVFRKVEHNPKPIPMPGIAIEVADAAEAFLNSFATDDERDAG